MLPAAHFGGLVAGVEIQYEVARAKGKSSRKDERFLSSSFLFFSLIHWQNLQILGADQSIQANFVQYGLESRFLGVILADSSRHEMWRQNQRKIGENVDDGGLFDVIITDRQIFGFKRIKIYNFHLFQNLESKNNLN
jgi:tRNA (guanine10-N2)-methyltransferase